MKSAIYTALVSGLCPLEVMAVAGQSENQGEQNPRCDLGSDDGPSHKPRPRLSDVAQDLPAKAK